MFAKITNSIRSLAPRRASHFTSADFDAATLLPPMPLPVAKGKRQAIPSYLTTAKPSQTPLIKSDRRLTTTDTLTYRNGTSTSKIIRDFAAASPELSNAVFAYLRIALTDRYTAIAKNMDGSFNTEATLALQQIITRLDVLPDYTQGFSGAASLLSLSESLAKELMFEGAMCGELVLDKARLPSRILPVSVSNLKMQPDKDGYLVPVQSLGGLNTILDAPTIFYIALDQSLLDAYPSSMLEPALKAIVFSESFVADIQRIVKRAIHPRLGVKIDEDKFRKNMPPEIENDQDAMDAYQDETIAAIQEMVNGLAPEDALVYFDSLGIDLINNGNASLSHEYQFIADHINAKLASGAKTLPAVLGMGGTSNVASVEAMLFVKSASGAIQKKLNEFYSRLFTLAVRLLGYDVAVEFRYAPIDLRSDSELEQFRAVKQSRILELLSLGMMTDEEASLELVGRLPAKGYTPLSGTMFKSKAASSDPNNDGSSNGGSALNKTQDGGSAGVKGKNKQADPQKTPADPKKTPPK